MAGTLFLGGRFFMGADYANGTASFFDVGTTTPLIVYSDEALTTSIGSVITLDENGSAIIYLPSDAKVEVVDKNSDNLYTKNGGIVKAATSSDANDNRATNASAEADSDSDGIPDSWSVTAETGSTNARISSDQTHGAWCFRSDDGGSGGGTWLHDLYIESSPNEEMGWDFEVIASHVTVRIVLDILWYDANKTQLTGGSAKTSVYDESAATPTSWTRAYGAVTPPAGAFFGRPQVALAHSSAASNGKWAQFDNLQLGKPTLAHYLSAAGDIGYADAANSVARLAKGSDGEVLTLAAGVPSWASGTDDTAYAASWDGDTTTPPSKNAVYDQLESMGSQPGAPIVKGSDEDVTSSTTLQADDALTTTIVANGVYIFEATAVVISTSGTPDYKWQWVTPDGDFVFITHACNTTSSTETTIADVSGLGDHGSGLTANVLRYFISKGLIRAGGTGGTFELQWAQSISDATATTVKAGSYMKLTKIA